ncbi:hypothetical protein QQP08_002192 [Theobroma cacao]|nr:hypothetical protein QQP08_002192 [Theobroma cacao]
MGISTRLNGATARDFPYHICQSFFQDYLSPREFMAIRKCWSKISVPTLSVPPFGPIYGVNESNRLVDYGAVPLGSVHSRLL